MTVHLADLQAHLPYFITFALSLDRLIGIRTHLSIDILIRHLSRLGYST